MAANRRRLEHGLQAGDLEDLPASGDNYAPWKDKPWQALAGMTPRVGKDLRDKPRLETTTHHNLHLQARAEMPPGCSA
jgi:hypothetical protein